jgi:ribosomal protein L40E
MDVGLVCDTCAALNPIGASQCSRCAAALAALDPRAQRRNLPPRPNGVELATATDAAGRSSSAAAKRGASSSEAADAPNHAISGAPNGATSGAPNHATSGALLDGDAPGEAEALSGALSDTRPGGRTARPSATLSAVQTAQQAAATHRCTRCGFVMKANLQFCPSCGLRVPSPFEVETKVRTQGRSTKFIRAMQVARAKLTLIRGDGEDGVSFMLAGEDHFAGRGDCPISFPEDPFLSPQHANFVYREDQLVVLDLDSLNGVYLRVTEAELTAQTTFLVGEQVLSARMATTPADAAEADGTYFSSSMPRPAMLEILQHLRGGVTGAVFRMETAVATVGREGNNIDFPEDPFISGRHAEIRLDGPSLSIKDLGSRNGTFVRIDKEQVLRHGDYVFMGQQLLRVEIV